MSYVPNYLLALNFYNRQTLQEVTAFSQDIVRHINCKAQEGVSFTLWLLYGFNMPDIVRFRSAHRLILLLLDRATLTVSLCLQFLC